MQTATVLVVENAATDPAGRLGEWLIAAGGTLQILRPHAGDTIPAGLDGLAGLVVLGGPQSAYDDSPVDGAPSFLPAVKALLREAVGAGTPTLGVCLGGQLLADALGGRVERNTDGPEIGAALVAKRDNAATDLILAQLPFTPDVIQWHYDSITELPPGATVLAASPRFPFQAFRVGDAAWGLQFHIETTPDVVRGWGEIHRARLEARGVDVDAILQRAAAIHPDLQEVWEPVAARFARLVRSRAGLT